MALWSEPIRQGGLSEKIKLMADYQCFPLWDASQEGGGRNIDPDELPISLSLKARLNLWRVKI